MTIVTLVGNPQPASRTRLVAEAVSGELARRSASPAAATIDLADVADELFRFPSPAVDELLARVRTAGVLVVASPTYKATYTGLLKAFLDRFGQNDLHGVVAVPILTIGSPAHTLAVDTALRPLLVELGASVPTRGIAFPAAAVDDRERIVAEWADAEFPLLASALGTA